MHKQETINNLLIFFQENSKKEVVSKLTTESREETHKQSFGAMQYMRTSTY